jgi:hypothetical protein
MNPRQEPVLWHRLKNQIIFQHVKLSATPPAHKLPRLNVVGSDDVCGSKGDRQCTAFGHRANRPCRHFISEVLPFMRHGTRLSTALVHELRGAVAEEGSP